MYIHLLNTCDRLGKILTGGNFQRCLVFLFKNGGYGCKCNGKFELNRELLKLL